MLTTFYIMENQIKKYFIFFQKTGQSTKMIFFWTYSKYIANKNNSKLIFFSEWTITENIKFELLNYRPEKVDYLDTTPQDELKIFLSYLMFVDELLDETEKKYTDAVSSIATQKEELWFAKNTWTLQLPQLEFQYKINPVFEALKGYVLLSELQKKFESEKYIEKYLSIYGFDSPWSLVSSFFNVLDKSIQLKNENTFPILLLPEESPYLDFFESKVFDVSEYQSSRPLQVRYKGIKVKPLIKIGNRQYLVLNWSFLFSQMYLGLLFDFYNKSGVKAIYKSIPDLKSETGKEISEIKLFRPVLKNIFQSKYQVLHFADSDGETDAYLREGNYIYLFEFKDILFPDAAIESLEFDSIKKIFDSKLIQGINGSPKGITQILNNINFLSSNVFSFDNFENIGIKRRNISICPIIIYDSMQFMLPGLNNYLNTQFKELMSKTSSEVCFKRVFPVTLVSLDYLYRNTDNFQQLKLYKFFGKYHECINAYKAKQQKSASISSLFKFNAPIELTSINLIQDKKETKKEIDKRVRNFLQLINVPQ